MLKCVCLKDLKRIEVRKLSFLCSLFSFVFDVQMPLTDTGYYPDQRVEFSNIVCAVLEYCPTEGAGL